MTGRTLQEALMMMVPEAWQQHQTMSEDKLGMVGPWQWIIIGLAILLLFGGKKLPELMKGLGGGIKEFKKATQEEDEEKTDDKKTDDKK